MRDELEVVSSSEFEFEMETISTNKSQFYKEERNTGPAEEEQEIPSLTEDETPDAAESKKKRLKLYKVLTKSKKKLQEAEGARTQSPLHYSKSSHEQKTKKRFTFGGKNKGRSSSARFDTEITSEITANAIAKRQGSADPTLCGKNTIHNQTDKRIVEALGKERLLSWSDLVARHISLTLQLQQNGHIYIPTSPNGDKSL